MQPQITLPQGYTSQYKPFERILILWNGNRMVGRVLSWADGSKHVLTPTGKTYKSLQEAVDGLVAYDVRSIEIHEKSLERARLKFA